MNTVVYHTQSLRPKSQSVNPPWREKTKLRESDLIGIVLVVIDSVCYGFVEGICKLETLAVIDAIKHRR